MAPTCTHERDVRRCPWCREEHSLHLGYPIEVAQLAHRRRWDDDPHTVASLSADARRAYAKAAGRVPREVECGECRGTGIDERASVQVGGPYMDDGSGAVPCGSCGGAGRWVEPRRVTAGDVVTLEAAIASAWEAVAS